MPFRSKAQQRFMFARHPAIAKRWASEYGVPKNLPDHKEKQMRVKPKPKKRVRAHAPLSSQSSMQQGFMQSGNETTNKIYKRERHKNRRFHKKHDGEVQHDPKGSEAKGNPNAPVGQGGRFAALQARLQGQKGVKDSGALAASIGRKKYGKKRFQKYAAKG